MPKQELLRFCQLLHQKNMLSACDGNLSVKTEKSILITPSGRPKAFLKEEDLATLDLTGKPIHNQASSESLMHLTVYEQCPQAKAVVHAHPPVATSFTIAFPDWTELPANSFSELILSVGSIPFIPYARPGTQEMGDVLKQHLPQSRVMILSHHGALAWGESLEEAYLGMERLEHSAQILYHALTLNKLHNLPAEEIEHFHQQYKKRDGKIL